MSNWKCVHCKYESENPYKNCKRCNYNRWEQEESNLENNHWNFSSHDDATILQDGGQFSSVDQESDELIWIKDSCNVTIQSTDARAAVSLQMGFQLAIALAIALPLVIQSKASYVSEYSNNLMMSKQQTENLC